MRRTLALLLTANLAAVATLVGVVGWPIVTSGQLGPWLPAAHAKQARALAGSALENAGVAPVLAGQEIVVMPGKDQAFACTLGLPWLTGGGQVVMLTAGHCLGEQSTARVVRVDGTDVGTAHRVPGADLAFIPVAQEDAMPYLQGIDPSDMRPSAQTMALLPAKELTDGQELCEQGRTTGLTCGWTVSDTDVTVTILNDSGGGDGRGARAKGHGGQCVAGGDSGGPVFAVDGQWAQPLGITTATSSTDPVLDAIPRVCSLLFIPNARITELIGGHPLTAAHL